MTKLTQLTSRLGLDPSSRSTLASLHVENKEEEQDEVMQLIKSLKE
jgi:phage terminase small subunit